MKDRITVRMSSEMLARLDAWIANQTSYVSRQEAVRRCLDHALSQGGPQAINNSHDKLADISREDKPPNSEVVFLD
jgi:Arc/MetJ-type ribon-helix-helix transcriptional regulator